MKVVRRCPRCGGQLGSEDDYEMVGQSEFTRHWQATYCVACGWREQTEVRHKRKAKGAESTSKG